MSILAGRALFAVSGPTRVSARAALRAALRGRPTDMTRQCQAFLRVLPTARTPIGWVEEWTPALPYPVGQTTLKVSVRVYLARREFLWAFLRAEARAARAAGRALQKVTVELARAYPWLSHWGGRRALTAAEIDVGLTNSDQAVDDTAAWIGGLLGSSIRPIMSQRRRGPRRKPAPQR